MNRDPEMWELTEKYGDRAFRLWYEILSVLDQNNNRISTSKASIGILAGTVRMRVQTVLVIVEELLARGWLAASQASAEGLPALLHAPKYTKYHRTQEPKGNGACSPPILSYPKKESEKKTKAKEKPVGADAPEFALIWNIYPRKDGRKRAREAWDKLNGHKPPIEVVLKAIDVQSKSHQWTKERGEFVPLLSTWIHQERWNDQGTITPNPPRRYGPI